METVSFLLAGIALIIAGCKKNDHDNKATSQKQLLTKVRVVQDASLVLEVDYDGDKFAEIRELSRDVITRYHDFAFDSKGKVVAFTKTAPGLQGTPTVLKHQITYFGDFLDKITVTQNVAGAPALVESYDFNKKNLRIQVRRRNQNQQLVALQTATYDSLGNIIQLIGQSLPGGGSDTLEFANYDKHPNTLDAINWFLNVNDFLPPSVNNAGTVTIKRGVFSPFVDQYSFEYNQLGNPAKIIAKGESMLLEYKDL